MHAVKWTGFLASSYSSAPVRLSEQFCSVHLLHVINSNAILVCTIRVPHRRCYRGKAYLGERLYSTPVSGSTLPGHYISVRSCDPFIVASLPFPPFPPQLIFPLDVKSPLTESQRTGTGLFILPVRHLEKCCRMSKRVDIQRGKV